MYAQRIVRFKLISTLLVVALSFYGCAEKTPEALVMEAKGHLQRHDHKSAIIELKSALQKQPDNVEARLLLGHSLHATGDYAAAEKEYTRARALGAPADQVMPLYGRLLLDSYQYSKVLEEIQALPTLGAEQTAAVQAYRAHALLKLDRKEEAAQALALAASRAPHHPEVLIVKSMFAVIERDLPKALALTEQALQQHPRHLEALMNKAALQSLQRQHAEALQTYQQIVALAPFAYQAHLAIARLLMAKQDLTAADRSIQAAERVAPQSSQVKSARALLEIRRGNFDRAQQVLNEVLKVRSDHPSTLLLHAIASLAQGHYEQSRRSAERLLALQPGNVTAAKVLAETYLKTGDSKRGIELLSPLLVRYPEDAGMLTLLGEAYMQQRNYAQALQLLEKAAALKPEDPAYRIRLASGLLAAGREESALEDLQQIAADSQQVTQADLTLIDLQIKKRDFDAALSSIDRLEKKQPDNPVAAYLRGIALLGKKNVPAARTALEKALKLDSGLIQAAAMLASLDFMDNKPEAARKRYEAVLAKEPKHLPAMIALAELSAAQGREQEARQWLERAAQAHPRAIPPRALLAQYHVRRKEYNQALSIAREAAANNPEDPSAIKLLASIQRAAGDKQNALVTYAGLVKQAPQSADAHYTLGVAQLAAGQKREGRASLERALQLQPDLIPALDALIALETGEARFDAALKLARQMQALVPAHPLGHVREGDIQLARQQPAQAAIAYRRAVERGAAAETLLRLHHTLTLAGDTKSANEALNAWLQRRPGDVAVRLYAADVAFAAGRLTEAIAHHEAILKEHPNHLQALNNLAELYRRTRDPRALATAERAHKLAPERPEILDTLGWILIENGQTARALPLLREAAAKSPKAPSIQYHYAVALAQSGARAEAKKTLQALLAAAVPFPEHEEAKALLSRL